MHFLALDLNVLGCKRSHMVRFYVYVHPYVYVLNLRKLPTELLLFVLGFQSETVVLTSALQHEDEVGQEERISPPPRHPLVVALRKLQGAQDRELPHPPHLERVPRTTQ